MKFIKLCLMLLILSACSKKYIDSGFRKYVEKKEYVKAFKAHFSNKKMKPPSNVTLYNETLLLDMTSIWGEDVWVEILEVSQNS